MATSIDSAPSLTDPDTTLLGIEPTLLYVTVRGRNAWHTTWITTYRESTDLSAFADEAKEKAEPQRRQGSVFQVFEVPGLALYSRAGTLLLAECHSPACFSRWDVRRGTELLRVRTNMWRVVAALKHDGLYRNPRPSAHSFVSTLRGWDPVKPLQRKRPLRNWTSYTRGAGQLEWLEDRATRSRRGVLAIQRAFLAANDRDVLQRAHEECDEMREQWAATERQRNTQRSFLGPAYVPARQYKD